MCVERFLRWLFKAEGVEVDVDELDWEILAGMGSGAEAGLEASGIETFAEAVGACAVLQNVVAASGAKYRVDDLVCFLCLSQHKETEPNTDIPAPALPVSVKTILDLDVPAQALQAQDLAAPAKAVSRRFKKNILAPLRTPPRNILAPPRTPPMCCKTQSPPAPSFGFVLASFQDTFLPWHSIGAAISLCQCCRALHGHGLFLAGWMSERKRRIADSVAAMLSFEAPAAAALLRSGVSRSTLLRTIARAWDWLEKCPRVLADEGSMTLALLRLSVKFEMQGDHRPIALALLGGGDGKPALHFAECRLVMALWARTDCGLDLTDCYWQHLARK